jgi:hemerythrin
MRFVWSTELSIGILELDQQHQELFEQIEKLTDACNQGTGTEFLSRMISYLERYSVEHFQTEERYMRRFNYPQLGYHQAQHQVFRKNLLLVKQKLETGGAGISLLNLTHALVVMWLNNHIKSVDKQMAAFLRERLEAKAQQQSEPPAPDNP